MDPGRYTFNSENSVFYSLDPGPDGRNVLMNSLRLDSMSFVIDEGSASDGTGWAQPQQIIGGELYFMGRQDLPRGENISLVIRARNWTLGAQDIYLNNVTFLPSSDVAERVPFVATSAEGPSLKRKRKRTYLMNHEKGR